MGRASLKTFLVEHKGDALFSMQQLAEPAN